MNMDMLSTHTDGHLLSNLITYLVAETRKGKLEWIRVVDHTDTIRYRINLQRKNMFYEITLHVYANGRYQLTMTSSNSVYLVNFCGDVLACIYDAITGCFQRLEEACEAIVGDYFKK